MHRSIRGRRHSSLFALTTALVLSVIVPATASAAFHLTKISEVYPGTGAVPDSAFIELQSYEAGQNLVSGHTITTYSAAGAEIHSFSIPGNVPNAQSQRTILIGDMFPPDAVNEDFTDNGLGTLIVPSGGAACFDAIPADCVTWGNYFGGNVLPGNGGAPVAPAGIPDGSSLVRSIAPGCATLLESTDDTDNSATDLSLTADPNPRPNTVTPTETPCGGGGGAAPETVIDKGPKKKIKSKKAKFTFSSPDAGATFECKLDSKPFKACTSPLKVKAKPGRHVFSVRAVLAGTPDGSPATYKFKRKRKKKK